MNNQKKKSKIEDKIDKEEPEIPSPSEKNIKLQVLQISLTAILVFLTIFSLSESFSEVSTGNLILIFMVILISIILILSFISEKFKSSKEREKQTWYHRINHLSLSRKIFGESGSPKSKGILLRELKRLYEKALLEKRKKLAQAYKSEIDEIEEDLE